MKVGVSNIIAASETKLFFTKELSQGKVLPL